MPAGKDDTEYTALNKYYEGITEVTQCEDGYDNKKFLKSWFVKLIYFRPSKTSTLLLLLPLARLAESAEPDRRSLSLSSYAGKLCSYLSLFL